MSTLCSNGKEERGGKKEGRGLIAEGHRHMQSLRLEF